MYKNKFFLILKLALFFYFIFVFFGLYVSLGELISIKKPSFIPKNKSIYKKINSKIFITKGKYGHHEVPDKIFFATEEGNLRKVIDIFPENVMKRQNVRISNSPTGKYIALDINYSIHAQKMEQGSFEFNNEWVKTKNLFKVINNKGEKCWETEGDQYREVFLTDEGIVVFGYLYEGYLDFYKINGAFVKKLVLSKRGKKIKDEDFVTDTIKYKYNQDNGFIVIARSFNELLDEKPFIRYTDFEIFLINLNNQKLEFKREIQSNVPIYELKLSIINNIILAKLKGLRAFNLQGETIWEKNITRSYQDAPLSFRIERIAKGKICIKLYIWEDIKKDEPPFSKMVDKKEIVMNSQNGTIIKEISIDDIK